MRARVAKKVRRIDSLTVRSVRPKTWFVAYRKLGRIQWRCGDITAGYRWGRWDHSLPMNPREPPF